MTTLENFKKTSVLRIYFESGSKVRGISFWKKLWSSDLAVEILKRAKEKGIKHALSFNINKGYIKNNPISMGISEIPSPKHPQCIELVDDHEKLSRFIDEYKELLGDSVTIYYNEEAFQNIR